MSSFIHLTLRRLTFVFVMAAMAVQPMLPAWAQEQAADVQPAETGTAENQIIDVPIPEVDSGPLPDPVVELTTGNDTSEKLAPIEGEEETPLVEDPVAPFEQFAINDNSGAKPKQAGEHFVDEATGSFGYGYPIVVPPGRNGFEPKLNLQYNHRRNNAKSYYGYGWDVEMPSIARWPVHGVDEMYDQYDFVLNLNGQHELVPIDAPNGYGLYGKLVETDFLKIEFLPNDTWKAADTLGTVYSFGPDTNFRKDNASDIFTWYLSEESDTNDNTIR